MENLAHTESQKGHLAAERISSLKIINAASGMMEAGQPARGLLVKTQAKGLQLSTKKPSMSGIHKFTLTNKLAV